MTRAGERSVEIAEGGTKLSGIERTNCRFPFFGDEVIVAGSGNAAGEVDPDKVAKQHDPARSLLLHSPKDLRLFSGFDANVALPKNALTANVIAEEKSRRIHQRRFIWTFRFGLVVERGDFVVGQPAPERTGKRGDGVVIGGQTHQCRRF
jgi:hypothetical protein